MRDSYNQPSTGRGGEERKKEKGMEDKERDLNP
jgi:hypothetical protein